MKGFIKTWWHCLWRMFEGHRMVSRVKISPADPLDWTYMHTEWSCSVCGNLSTPLTSMK